MKDFCVQTDFDYIDQQDFNIFYCNIFYNQEVSTYCNFPFNKSIAYSKENLIHEEDFVDDVEESLLCEYDGGAIKDISKDNSRIDELKLRLNELLGRLDKTVDVSLKINKNLKTSSLGSADALTNQREEVDELNDTERATTQKNPESPTIVHEKQKINDDCQFLNINQTQNIVDRATQTCVKLDKTDDIKTEPKAKKKLRCKTCLLVFNELDDLIAHVKETHQPANVSLNCDQCSKSFALAYQLQAHKEEHHNEKTEIHCGFCSLKFSQTLLYINHVKGFHTYSKIEPIVGSQNCDICGKAYTDAKLLRKHRQFHKKVHKCDQCPKAFSVPVRLQRHKASHSMEQPYSCELCNSKFRTRAYKAEHMKMTHLKSITDSKITIHECHICQKQYAYNFQLKRHLLSHSNDKPYPCDMCSRQFRRISELDKHKFKMHSVVKDGVRTYSCDICSKKFLNNCELKSHKYTHDEIGSFSCDLCDSKFHTPNGLKLHKSVHFPEQNKFKCQYCEKSFAIKPRLLRHVRSHTGEKPFECDICQTKFSDRGNLTAHVKSVHGVYVKTITENGTIDMKLKKYKRPSRKRGNSSRDSNPIMDTSPMPENNHMKPLHNDDQSFTENYLATFENAAFPSVHHQAYNYAGFNFYNQV